MSAARFEVWAPRATLIEVELVPSERRIPMERGDGGWHSLPAEEITSAYFLRVDGGDRITDPRATEVESVLGPCHRLDPASFRWTDARFQPPSFRSGIVYELHVGTFSREGTFDGAIQHLGHLVELGITHIELMPVASFSGHRGWGYDGAALFAPHRAYGGPDGLVRLVDAAHARGLAVLLDVVYNHLGPVGNWLSSLGPYFHEGHGTPWGGAINFDGPGSDEVRRFFLDNALAWLRDYHMDGLRLDAIQAIRDGSALPFLEQLGTEVHALSLAIGKPLVLVAESDLNDPRLVRSPRLGGLGLDAMWSDDFHHALHVALTGERHAYYADYENDPLEGVAKALTSGWVFDGQRSRFRDRSHGRPFEGSLHSLVGYAQTHDQVGNRPNGERLAALASIERAKIALALVLTSPFTPMLFMGEEWAASAPFFYFTDHHDPNLAWSVQEGRKRELRSMGFAHVDPPDPQAESTFVGSKLDWNEVTRGEHAEMLSFVRRLTRLRREHAALSSGERPEVHVDRRSRTLVMKRGPFTIAVNLGDAQRVSVGHRSALCLASTDEVRVSGDALEMPPDTVAIVRAAGAE